MAPPEGKVWQLGTGEEFAVGKLNCTVQTIDPERWRLRSILTAVVSCFTKATACVGKRKPRPISRSSQTARQDLRGKQKPHRNLGPCRPGGLTGYSARARGTAELKPRAGRNLSHPVGLTRHPRQASPPWKLPPNDRSHPKVAVSPRNPIPMKTSDRGIGYDIMYVTQ